MKRILTIQDFSCLGKCSASVALPVISAMGIETVVLPSAILSSHTAFPSFEKVDTADMISRFVKHWESEKLHFDGIYIAYLGSIEAIQVANEIIDIYADEDTFVMIDPVLGDEGCLYTGFDDNYKEEIMKLCKRADLITPNFTEALLMVGEDVSILNTLKKSDHFEEVLLEKMKAQGFDRAVITSVDRRGDCDDEISILAYDKKTSYHITHEKLNILFPGTGDLFSSTLFGALINGKSMGRAMEIAYKFILKAIKITLEEKNHNWYGVNFEKAIPYLLDLINR
ncbi:MAG: pyridoxamine kinase [Clostridia bacterium]|nr:pyridoxamine kinase [Clostridia bacterium]